MFSKKYFTKFLSALLAATIVIAVLPLNGISVFAAEDDHSSDYKIKVVDSRTKNIIKDASVDFEHIDSNPYNNFTTDTQTTDDNGLVYYSLFDFLNDRKEHSGAFPDYEFTLNIYKDGTGYKYEGPTTDHPNNMNDGWKQTKQFELHPTDLNDCIVFEDDTNILFDNTTHNASEFFEATGEGIDISYSGDKEFKNVGTYKFTVSFSGEGYYNSNPKNGDDEYTLSRSFEVTVSKKVRENYHLANELGEEPAVIDFTKVNTYTNKATAPTEEEPQAVKYYSSNETVAKVDDKGVVLFSQPGKVTIKAVMAESDNFAESEKSYDVVAKTHITVSFEQPLIVTNYGVAVPSNPLNITNPDSVDTKTQFRITNDDEGKIAKFEDDGKLSIEGVGTVEIEATVTGDYCFTENATYELEIQRGKHSLVKYPATQVFYYNKPYKIFADEKEVKSFTANIPAKFRDNIFIDYKNKTFTIKNIPTDSDDLKEFKFSVYVAPDDKYEEFSGVINLNPGKVDQNIGLESNYICYTRVTDVWAATDHNDFELKLDAGEVPHGEFKYEITSDSNDLIDRITYNATAKKITVFYKLGAVANVHDSVAFKISFVNDANYNDVEISSSVKIVNKSFNTHLNYYGVTGENDYYTSDVLIHVDPGSNDVTFQNPYDTTVQPDRTYTLDKNGEYASETVTFYEDIPNDDDENIYTRQGTVDELKIDKTAPVDFSVDIINENANKPAIFKIIDDLTFGLFSSNDLRVDVTVRDVQSGFGRVEYAFGSGDYKECTVDSTAIQSKNTVVVTFRIPNDKEGILRVRAYDYAGNIVSTHDEHGNPAKVGTYFRVDGEHIKVDESTLQDNQDLYVVSDKIAPKVKVTFSYNDASNEIYYKEHRTATIEIDEANYYSDDVQITVKKNNEVFDNKTALKDGLGVTYDDDHKKIIVPFNDDAKYTFTIKYSDRSSNEAEITCDGTTVVGTYSTTFVIDTKEPEVNVSYTDKGVHNGSYFSEGRTATITVKELNYDEKDLKLNIQMRKGNESGFTTVSSSLFHIVRNTSGSTNTISIDFTDDADYKFSVSFNDLAGNGCVPKYSGSATGSFTIDNTDPVVKVAYSDAPVHNGFYFNKDRTATITVTEHNFDKENTVILVKGDKVPVTWKDDGDEHVATVEFTKDDEYTFAVTCIDKAERSCGKVDFGSSQAPDRFILDKTKPTALTITIGDKSVLGGESVTFDTFYKDAIKINLGANCDISGLDTIEYQLVDDASDFSLTGKWELYTDAVGINVTDNLKFIVYVKVTDKASNVEYANSTGIIVDNKEPEGERYAPDIDTPDIDIIPAAANANGYYKGDVSVQLNVVDPKYIGDSYDPNGYYSGLNKITYEIYTTDTDAIEQGTLFDLSSNPKIGSSDAEFDRYNLAAAWSKTITIDSRKFNSNNVIVQVTATDNAGNTRVTNSKAGSIKIDVTAPTINVSYNNNEVDLENCFKADRVATVVITERNFNPNDVIATITSSTGNTITVDGWTKTPGTGNEDNTRWTATITYDSDADYTFDIAFTDLAGNVAGPADYGDSAAPTAFTIDKTLPTVNVTYDNNDVANDMYYKSARTATVTIVEHNFNASRVTVSLQASDDGSAIEAPSLSGWTTYGDTHTATISYSNDGKYVFDISVKDNAGNNSAEFAEQTFVVDTKAPSLSITGVVDKSANNGVVAPVITYSDTNFSADLVTINFSGANRGVLKLDGTSTDIHNGKNFVFNNFANEKSMDDIYTLEVTLTDLAGNTSTQKVQFSVNRFGSTYAMSNETKAIDGRYIQAPIDVVFTEVNPNALVDFKVTVFKNNSPVVLTKGVDYDVEEVGGEGTWREYKYIIHADNFADDGVYAVTIYSEDEAGNISENTLDTKNVDSKSSLQFGVDKTLPNIVASNLNSNTTYAVELYTVKLLVSDNLKLHSIDVYLDNSTEPYRTWSAEEIAAIVSGEYVFNIDDSSTSAHNVRIVATDEAGNVQELTVSNFYVTTNLFVRYYTNTPLFVGSIIGFILLIALIVFIVVMSRRREYSRR